MIPWEIGFILGACVTGIVAFLLLFIIHIDRKNAKKREAVMIENMKKALETFEKEKSKK